jgi:dihydroorotase
MKDILIKSARIVNENEVFPGSLIIHDGKIHRIIKGYELTQDLSDYEVIDGDGKYLLPGIIDEHVHFREPGLTHKGDISSESAAAVAGGITSFMEMPNTVPQTTTLDLLEQKHELASQKSLANYSFYLGATNDNLREIKKIDPAKVCGLKLFMGASTGNMLVDKPKILEGIFAECPVIIVLHCEDEKTIRKNSEIYREKYGDKIPPKFHPLIRSTEACIKSSSSAVSLARKYKSRAHILHISSRQELDLFEPVPLSPAKLITAEVCVHHLWFDDNNYKQLGNLIKWNPAVKTADDRNSLYEGLIHGRLDVIATDHAPHTLEEKKNTYFNSPSGGPLIQHSLPAMLELFHLEKLSIQTIVNKMAHSPARLFNIKDRGFIQEGYWADLVLVDPESPWTVTPDNILYKCKWSPFMNQTFHSKIICTFVNGRKVYENPAGDTFTHNIYRGQTGMRLDFERE